VSLLTPAEALDVVRGELGLGLADRFWPGPLVVDVTKANPELTALAEMSGALPCVVVGVAAQGTEAPKGFDVLLCESMARRPWVHCDDLETSLSQLCAGTERSPEAAVALVQLLRMSEPLSLHHAVVAESFVYSTLQAGPGFRTWLETRDVPAERPADEGEPVVVSRNGPELDIELHRPSVRNALNAAMRDALIDAFALVEVDPTIERARLHGSGPSFCSGGDLREFGTAPDPATAHIVRVSRSVGLALARCSDRVSVEVHGTCVGAGIEIPTFSRWVTATPDATFRLPEVEFGLIPGAGGTVSLPRRIGRHRTAFAALTGSTISALTAQDWGLVDEVRN
jgi:hypothetical protein